MCRGIGLVLRGVGGVWVILGGTWVSEMVVGGIEWGLVGIVIYWVVIGQGDEWSVGIGKIL